MNAFWRSSAELEGVNSVVNCCHSPERPVKVWEAKKVPVVLLMRWTEAEMDASEEEEEGEASLA